MSELTKVLRTEICRVAKKEARGLVEPVRKSSSAAKRELVALKRRVAGLERALSILKKSTRNPAAAFKPVGPARAIRFTARGVRAQRDRLGMPTDNPELIAYAKVAQANGQTHPNAVLVVVNLDFHHVQSGWVTLDLDALHLDASQPFHVHALRGETPRRKRLARPVGRG